MTTLVLAEHDGRALKPDTRSAVTAALQLGEPVHLLVAGHDVSAIVDAGAAIAGVDTVLVADNPGYEYPLAETVAKLVLQNARSYSAILAAATPFGKSVLPRAAAGLDVQQISEIASIIGPDTFVRPVYAGNALATVRSIDALKVITVRATAFEPAAVSEKRAAIQRIDTVPPAVDVKFVRQDIVASDRPSLTAARVVISGGRAMQSSENFKQLLEPVAEKLGAAIGASRAAVDAGFASNDLQVGQTGKIVAPELYIAVGISGAIQHLAGMSDSKFIVAINKDAEAPIFEIADYGLVADLFAALPELTVALERT